MRIYRCLRVWVLLYRPQVCCLPKVQLSAFATADTIQCDRFEASPLPVSTTTWFTWALQPANDERIRDIHALGREHAGLWLQNDRDCM